MAKVSVHEAKTHLFRLLQRVAGGEEIVIARAGKPVAKLVPIEPKPHRIFGQDEGLFEVPEDFDAPLPVRRPVAELRPVPTTQTGSRPFGLCAGAFTVPDDFDAPLPEEILQGFEGR